jgi:ABC-type transport system involved in multi-copper enzyme maturation permease subunit
MRLLIKECRAIGILLVGLGAFLAVSILLNPKTGSFMTPGVPYPGLWISISFVYMLIFGSMAYSVEIGKGTVDFLYSLPVSWRRIMSAKFGAGVVFSISASVLAAVIFIILGPAPYRHLPLQSFALASSFMFLILFAGYSAGLLVSITQSSPFTAVAMFVGTVISVWIVLLALVTIGDTHPVFKALNNPDWRSVIPVFLGAFIGAVLVARGITWLDVTGRLRIWIPCTAAGLVLAILFAVSYRTHGSQVGVFPEYGEISPDGKFAVCGFPVSYHGKQSNAQEHLNVIDTTTSRIVMSLWDSTGGLVIWSHDSRKFAVLEDRSTVKVVDMKTRRVTMIARAPKWAFFFSIFWSPDDSEIAIVGYPRMRGKLVLSIGNPETRTVRSSVVLPYKDVASAMSAAMSGPVVVFSGGQTIVLWPPVGEK